MIHSHLLKHKLNNILQSLILLLSMAGILGLLGWIIAGPEGLAWSAALGLFTLLFGVNVSPQLVLRLYQARPITWQQAPDLYRLLGNLVERAGLDHVPRLYYIPSRLLNAFALGNRRSAVIALTDGLLRTMKPNELAGVLAHELSHVRNNDTWVMGLADVVSRLTALFSQLGLLLILVGMPILLLQGIAMPLLPLLILLLAPTTNALLQLALSRTREYEADLSAVEITGDPQGLASALDKLERYQGGWLERIFMPGRREPDPALLRTHPPTSERIRRLLELVPRYRNNSRHRPLPTQLPNLAEWPSVTRSPRWHLTGLWH